MSESAVTSEDREHAKRIVYSVVYGAGEYTRAHTHTQTHTQAYSQLVVIIDIIEDADIHQTTGQLIFIVSERQN